MHGTPYHIRRSAGISGGRLGLARGTPLRHKVKLVLVGASAGPLLVAERLEVTLQPLTCLDCELPYLRADARIRELLIVVFSNEI